MCVFNVVGCYPVFAAIFYSQSHCDERGLHGIFCHVFCWVYVVSFVLQQSYLNCCSLSCINFCTMDDEIITMQKGRSFNSIDCNDDTWQIKVLVIHILFSLKAEVISDSNFAVRTRTCIIVPIWMWRHIIAKRHTWSEFDKNCYTTLVIWSEALLRGVWLT